MLGNALIAADFGGRQFSPGMASPHDGILDAAQGQALSPFLAVVSLVGIDDLLVAADQMITFLAIADIGGVTITRRMMRLCLSIAACSL